MNAPLPDERRAPDEPRLAEHDPLLRALSRSDTLQRVGSVAEA